MAVDGTNLIGIDTAATSALVQGNESVVSPFENNWIVANLEPSEKYPLLLENIVVYISGFVVRKVATKIGCDTCRQSLFVSAVPEHKKPSYSLLIMRDMGGLVTPSPGTVAILMATEAALRRNMNVASASHKCSRFKVLQSVKQQCGANDILCLSDHITESQHGIDNHYYSVIELVVTTYINLRQKHIARLHTRQMKQTSVRKKLTKLILFKGD